MPNLPFFRMQVRGIQKIQRANMQLLETANPRGGLGVAVKEATQMLQRYATVITHRVTGTLAASHLADFGSGGVFTTFTNIPVKSRAIGRIYINPNVRNPISGEKPSIYGIVEHEKGGSHAFYKRTYEERGPAALVRANQILQSRLPKGGGRV
jgi:hypothetical protein